MPALLGGRRTLPAGASGEVRGVACKLDDPARVVPDQLDDAGVWHVAERWPDRGRIDVEQAGCGAENGRAMTDDQQIAVKLIDETPCRCASPRQRVFTALAVLRTTTGPVRAIDARKALRQLIERQQLRRLREPRRNSAIPKIRARP